MQSLRRIWARLVVGGVYRTGHSLANHSRQVANGPSCGQDNSDRVVADLGCFVVGPLGVKKKNIQKEEEEEEGEG